MRVMVVDDENLALSRMERLLEQAGVDNVSTYQDPTEALKAIRKERYDVIFLDISMPEMTGLEFADQVLEISPQTFIVFQTAYSEHALDAFESGGVGYLMKPVSQEELDKTLHKIKTLSLNNTATKKIMGKSGSRFYLINPEDIYYLKADLDEVIIKIKEADVYVRRKIGEMDKLLSTPNFFRVHRSYIVNIDKIKSMRSVEQSKLEISFDGISSIVTTSKDGAKEFREYLDRISL
ncbi:MAG TPA: response regulator transcription factor [Campylobacterales bacterium]|nr:response regulator transcription factor [Campylobacterales bacterium]